MEAMEEFSTVFIEGRSELDVELIPPFLLTLLIKA
jgi:hypothetical protein